MTAGFPRRDDHDQPVAERGYRFVRIEFDKGDHEFPPRWYVVAWSATWNNAPSNPNYWYFPTEAEARAFAETIPARAR